MEEHCITCKNVGNSNKPYFVTFFLLVTFFHWHFYHRVVVVTTNSMVHLVDTFLPIRVIVLMKDSLVSAGQDDQASIFRGDTLHGRPGTYYTIGRSKGEIVQVLYHNYNNELRHTLGPVVIAYLMKRMARSLATRIRWFVNQHCMHSANIGPSKALDMV